MLTQQWLGKKKKQQTVESRKKTLHTSAQVINNQGWCCTTNIGFYWFASQYAFVACTMLLTDTTGGRASEGNVDFVLLLWAPVHHGYRYLCPHYFPDGSVKFKGVVVVHREDVGSADVLLCVRMLRGHLQHMRAVKLWTQNLENLFKISLDRFMTKLNFYCW